MECFEILERADVFIRQSDTLRQQLHIGLQILGLENRGQAYAILALLNEADERTILNGVAKMEAPPLTIKRLTECGLIRNQDTIMTLTGYGYFIGHCMRQLIIPDLSKACRDIGTVPATLTDLRWQQLNKMGEGILVRRAEEALDVAIPDGTNAERKYGFITGLAKGLRLESTDGTYMHTPTKRFRIFCIQGESNLLDRYMELFLL